MFVTKSGWFDKKKISHAINTLFIRNW